MAQKLKKERVAVAAEGLLVSDRSRLAKSLAQSLKHGAGLKHCQPIEIPRAGGSCYEFTQGAPISVAQRKVFELLQGDLQTYWLGLKVDFVHETKWGDLLTHASIALFCGASPQSALPLFRAEWDPREKGSGHAQPHWNLQREILRRDLAVPSRFSPEEFQQSRWQAPGEEIALETGGNQSSLDWMCDFHFAMSSTWHASDGQHSPCRATEELLRCWVRGCVEYIRAQLISAHARAA